MIYAIKRTAYKQTLSTLHVEALTNVDITPNSKHHKEPCQSQKLPHQSLSSLSAERSYDKYLPLN